MNNQLKLHLVKEVCINNGDNITIFGQLEKNEFVIKHVTIKTENKFFTCNPCYYKPNKLREMHVSDFYLNFKCTKNDIFEKPLEISIYFQDESETIRTEQFFEFPFDDIREKLPGTNNNVITTMCVNYNNRLDEWIQYNLKLGFDAIIIFDNGSRDTDEKCNLITDKYDNVFSVKFPYGPAAAFWNNIQRISLSLGCNGLKSFCKYITLIDGDEFIYIPNGEMNIRKFLDNYDETLQMQSYLFTNISNDKKNKLENNYLDQCRFADYENKKYEKLFLRASDISENEFIYSPHKYTNQLRLEPDLILHYHCWANERHKYNSSMKKINFLYDFLHDK
tara:strand:- start:767 stop:1771 length:1005 start_codon:yes stop_codon:yes gene_type:complete